MFDLYDDWYVACKRIFDQEFGKKLSWLVVNVSESNVGNISSGELMRNRSRKKILVTDIACNMVFMRFS